MSYKYLVPAIKVGDAISSDQLSGLFVIVSIRTVGNKYHFDLSNALTMTFDTVTNLWAISSLNGSQVVGIDHVDIYEKLDIKTIRNEKINELLR